MQFLKMRVSIYIQLTMISNDRFEAKWGGGGCMVWRKIKYSKIIELFVNKCVMWSLCDVVYKGKTNLK